MANTPPEFDPQHISQQMKDSAQQIWQAGLGALAKAQEEGGKVYDNLVKEGSPLQQTTQQAQTKLAQAAEKMSHLASQMGESANVQIDKLEHIFEKRVAKAMESMGLPSTKDLADLEARVALLEQQLAAARNTKD